MRLFFFNDTATTEIYTLSLHDALPISEAPADAVGDLEVLAGGDDEDAGGGTGGGDVGVAVGVVVAGGVDGRAEEGEVLGEAVPDERGIGRGHVLTPVAVTTPNAAFFF